MKSAFIIKDKTGKPYAVVALLAGGTEFYPIAESATTWASWMKDEYAARAITKQQLSSTLDNSMDVEGPLVTSRANKVKIDELIAKAKKTQEVEPIESAKEQKSAELVPVISLMDARLDYLENSEWRNAVEFKAKSFIADVNKSTFAYEVKRTRAVFDESLAIPGTDRRGGWRCPPGTRYGGQITDRFGRNCGWGVSRRLANEISDIGERLENVGDKRRERRVSRRNERVGRRLAQGGRIERAARRVGDALESTNRPDAGTADSPETRGTGLLERAARRVGDALDSQNNGGRRRRGRRGGAVGAFIEGFREGWNGEETLPDGTLPELSPTPKIPMGGVREPRLPDGIVTPGKTPAPRRPKAPQARPAKPRQPRKPRQPDILPNGGQGVIPPEGRYPNGLDGGGQGVRPRPGDIVPERQPRAPRRQPDVDNVSRTPVPAGAPRASETLEQYKTRKYNEHQQRVREIREAGGNAGLLRREEWEKFHGPAVEENWNRAQQRNAGRGARRTATDAGAARTATRRPKPADVPDANQPARRQRKPFNAPGQRGVNDLAAARRKREFIEQENPAQRGDYKIVKHNGKYYVVSKAEVDRANANGANLDVHNEPPRPGPRRTQVPPMITDTPSPANVTPPSEPSKPARNVDGKDAKISDLIPVEPPHKAHKPDRLENNALGHTVVNGVLVPDVVEKGNKNINSVAEAISFVANGGSLDDVPDEFVHAAIFDNAAMPGEALNGRRFQLSGDPGNGINGRGQLDVRQKTYLVKDSVTGRQYIMKSPSWVQDEVIGEQYAALLGQLAGRPMARVRVIGPREERINENRGANNPQNNNQILVEHFGGIIDGPIAPGNQMPQNADRRTRATVQFIDNVLGNPDRHPGNYLWAGNEQIPIDHGILPRGDGKIVAVSTTRAAELMNNASFSHIRQSFRRISNSDIEAIVEQQGKVWRAAGIPEDTVNANMRAMKTTFRNLVDSARG